MRVDLIALIPAYNEETVIAATLQSLLRAGMLPEKIVVINDASTDRTAEIARSFGVVVFNNEKNMGKAGGVTNALCTIFSHPRYKDLTHVSFLDADTLVDPKYFQAVREHLSEDLKKCEKTRKRGKRAEPISILCGRAKSLPHNWLTAFRACEYWISYAIYKPGQAKIRTTTVAPGCASTYSVEALRYVTWTDDTVVEDMDATIQVALADGVIAYEKDAVVYTQDPQTLHDYIGQLGKRWYAGSWQVMGKHHLLWPARGVLRYFGVLLFAVLLSYLITTHSQYLSLILGSLTATSYLVCIVLNEAEKLHSFLLPHHGCGPWYRRTKLEWYCRATHGEAFLYIGGILFTVLKHREYLPHVLLGTFAATTVVALLASWREKRIDILKYSLIFPFINVLNLALLVSKVPNFFGRKKGTRRAWHSNARYAINATADTLREESS